MAIALRVFVSSLFFVWVIYLVDMRAMGQLIERTNLIVFLSTSGLILSAMLIGAWRWWLLARQTGLNVPLYPMVPGYFVGIFFNNIMPVTVGGDVARTLFLSQRGHNFQQLVSSAILDRWFGLLSVLLTVIVAALVRPNVIGDSQNALLVLAIVLLFFMGGIFLIFVCTSQLSELHVRYGVPKWISDWLVLQAGHLVRCQQSLKFALLILAISFVSQGCISLAYYVIGQYLGIPIAFVDYLVIVPAIMLAQALPISLAGLGVREAASVWVFVAAGVSQQHAVFISLVMLLVLWIVSAPGGIVALLFRWRKGSLS